MRISSEREDEGPDATAYDPATALVATVREAAAPQGRGGCADPAVRRENDDVPDGGSSAECGDEPYLDDWPPRMITVWLPGDEPKEPPPPEVWFTNW